MNKPKVWYSETKVSYAELTTMSTDDLSERILKPAMAALKASIEDDPSFEDDGSSYTLSIVVRPEGGEIEP